jgi:hypothetical protein
MQIYILDDIYWNIIYNELNNIFNYANFPIKENIDNPLLYINDIIKNEPDFVLLDHWFIDNDWFENPLWLSFLKELDKKLCTEEKVIDKNYFFFKTYKTINKYRNIKTKIISISDNWIILKENEFYNKYITDYITTKKWTDISIIINK